jgi:hypothetical protein
MEPLLFRCFEAIDWQMAIGLLSGPEVIVLMPALGFPEADSRFNARDYVIPLGLQELNQLFCHSLFLGISKIDG